MRRLMKFLLGLAIGAGAAVLVAPKSGRELRKQLFSGASARLLPSPSDDYSPPAPDAWSAPMAAPAPAASAEAEPFGEWPAPGFMPSSPKSPRLR